MSADQRGLTPVAPADERTRLTNPTPTARHHPRQSGPPNGSVARSDPHDVPLSARIERTRLRVRIAALERLVAMNETRRQAVIDQYERLLADRNNSVQDDSASSSSLLAKLPTL
ncbi:hypothetical protein A6E15_15205 [Natrinema saccharevitans]|uniref:Uncharacterized protein n=1 Tax=Natrinema saccharevitans TaxID=301967 RepID=A0A1S8B0A9_9EURY|nr:hypothetical protein A6E15_15205 [Natrinema saccharevitans]